MGVKVSNDNSTERTHQIHSPKFMCTPRGLHQSVVKFEFENLNFLDRNNCLSTH